MQVLVSDFPGKDYASEALMRIKTLDLKSGSAAIISKDAHSKIRVKETDDWAALKGVAGGAVLAIVGCKSCGVAGSADAEIHDGGFPDDRLKAMAHNLEPNSSVFLALADSELIPALKKVMREMGGVKDINRELTQDLSKTLSEAPGEELGHIAESRENLW
jgi:uncharacterized membrane protein